MKKWISAAVVICMLTQPAMGLAEETPEIVMETTAEMPVSETTPVHEVTPVPEETPAPEETPISEETPVPEETPAGSETESPTPSPTEAAVPEDAEAWMETENGLVWGSLADMIAAASENAEILLHTDEVMFVKDAPLLWLSGLTLIPDGEIFGDGEYRVAFAEQSPETADPVDELNCEAFKEAGENDAADLYIWVVKVETAQPDPTDTPELPTEICVEAADYAGAVWSSVHPTCLLSGIPEGNNWSYAVIIYDERIAVLSGSEYFAAEEGVYTVRFAMLDEQGDIVDASELYTLWLDHTAPDVMAVVDESISYTMHLSASDAMSGVDAVSLDGGVSWTPLGEDGIFTYTAAGATELAPGMVQVRDIAGNVWSSLESYALEAIVVDNGGGYGGGGGGGGDSKPARQHAKGDSEGDTVEYDALSLELPEEPMQVLNIGGEELPLTLELTAAEGFAVPEDYQPAFTAEMTAWPKAASGDEDAEKREPEKDTLVLTAVEEENLGDRFEYRWKFNGGICRLLANSGVRYIVLRVGEDAAALPVEGFIGGTRYTELKMQGVSTKKFDYTVAMTFNLDPDHIPMLSEYDFSESCDLALQVEVENIKYALSAEQKGEMYYYNVWLGPVEMLEVPFGEFGSEKAKTTEREIGG